MVDVGTESTGIFVIQLQKMAHLAKVFVFKNHISIVSYLVRTSLSDEQGEQITPSIE